VGHQIVNPDKCLVCEWYVAPSNDEPEQGLRHLWAEEGFKYPHRCSMLMCYESEQTEHSKHIKYPKTYAEIISVFSKNKTEE